MSYTPTIGLEVHAELKTKSKMFCGCKNDPHDTNANENICPVCLAHPGTLPVPNEQAIECVLMFGQAVNATVATYSEFDRKNYFYPDIPKAYQISQYAFPFLSGGELNGIALTRVHLEEDTARSQHDKGSDSLVDFNRGGVPLMELVTEPVMHDAKTVGDFARELQLLLRTLDISDANMERGEMRVEANISVSKENGKLGTKVEVKNLNSFKAVEAAIDYEIARQIEVLESGGTLIQETRGWDEAKSKTFTQRTKETAMDYRYFPDPDIPKINISDHGHYSASRIAEKMPELPSNKRVLYTNLGLSRELIEVIIADMRLDAFFAQLLVQPSFKPTLTSLCANYLTSDVLALITKKGDDLDTLNPEHFVELMLLLEQGTLSSRVAKDILPRLFDSELGPAAIAESEGLLQQSDPSALLDVVRSIIESNEVAVTEYKAGKEASLKYLVGQGMKLTKGTANPEILTKLLSDELAK